MEVDKELPETEMTVCEQSWPTDDPRIDKDKGILHHAHIMGTVSKAGYTYSAESITAAAPRFEQMCVGIDHNYGPDRPMKTGEHWGVVKNVTNDQDGIWGDLHYNQAHPLTAQILYDLEHLKTMGLSPVNQVVERGNIVSRFTPRRLDLVVGPATTKNMFEQAQVQQNEELASLKSTVEQLTAKQADFETRLKLREEFVPPVVKAEQTAPKPEPLDLEKFWADRKKDK